MRRIVLMLLVICAGCKKKSGSNNGSVVQTLDSVPNGSFSTAVSGDTALSPFVKSLEGNGYVYKLKGIQFPDGKTDLASVEIYSRGKLHQKVNFDTVYLLNEEEAFFSVDKDVNFDGYNDLEIVKVKGNYFSKSSFWLYDHQDKKYIHTGELDEIFNPEIDAVHQLIYSSYHIGPSDHYSEVYKWKNKRLVLMNRQVMENDNP